MRPVHLPTLTGTGRRFPGISHQTTDLIGKIIRIAQLEEEQRAFIEVLDDARR
jgi:hypothetical protein